MTEPLSATDLRDAPTVLGELPVGFGRPHEELTWRSCITRVAPLVRPHRRLYVHFFREDPRTGEEEFVMTLRIDSDRYLNLQSLPPTAFTGVILGDCNIDTFYPNEPVQNCIREDDLREALKLMGVQTLEWTVENRFIHYDRSSQWRWRKIENSLSLEDGAKRILAECKKCETEFVFLSHYIRDQTVIYVPSIVKQ